MSNRVFNSVSITQSNGLLLGTPAAGHTFSASGVGTVNIPDATGVLILDSVAATLTNKTITDPSNNVAATALQTNTGTPVSVSAAAVPMAGQVLTALTPTTAAWALPSTSGSTGSSGTATGAAGAPVVLETFASSDNAVYMISTSVAGRRTDVAGTGAGIGLLATYRRAVGAASLTRIGQVDDTVSFRADNTWSLATSSNTTSGVISLLATAGAGQTVAWKSSTLIQVV